MTHPSAGRMTARTGAGEDNDVFGAKNATLMAIPGKYNQGDTGDDSGATRNQDEYDRFVLLYYDQIIPY